MSSTSFAKADTRSVGLDVAFRRAIALRTPPRRFVARQADFLVHGERSRRGGHACDRPVAREVLLGLELSPPRHRLRHSLRGQALTTTAGARADRLLYLDWLRGLAVVAMILAHVDRFVDARRRSSARAVLHTVLHRRAGVAAVSVPGGTGRLDVRRLEGSARGQSSRPAPLPRERAAGRSLRSASSSACRRNCLEWARSANLLRVDMLNAMGLSLVAASWAWQASRRSTAAHRNLHGAHRRGEPRHALRPGNPWLSPLPDPLEAYLRPAGVYTAFPLFPWAGFLFAGALVGDLVDAVRAFPAAPRLAASWARADSERPRDLAGVDSRHFSRRSSQPPASGTIRRRSSSSGSGVATLTVPVAWLVERVVWRRALLPMATLGRASLFAYWIHIEMVYGVIAEPIKRRCRCGSR